MQEVRLKTFLAAEASITLPLPTVICPKIRMVRLIITSSSLILIIEIDGITIHRPGCDVQDSWEGSIDLFTCYISIILKSSLHKSTNKERKNSGGVESKQQRRVEDLLTACACSLGATKLPQAPGVDPGNWFSRTWLVSNTHTLSRYSGLFDVGELPSSFFWYWVTWIPHQPLAKVVGAMERSSLVVSSALVSGGGSVKVHPFFLK